MRDVGTDHRAAVAEVQEVVRGGTFCSLQDINMLMKLSSYHHTTYGPALGLRSLTVIIIDRATRDRVRVRTRTGHSPAAQSPSSRCAYM